MQRGPAATNIPIEVLRSFVTVVETGSVTKAAERLNITHAGLSAQIRKLEVCVAGPLFTRANGALTPSSKGELLLGFAEKLLEMNDKIISTAGQDVDCRRIGIPQVYAERFLKSASAACTRAIPEFRYIFSCGSSSEIAKSLLQGYLDIAVFADIGGQSEVAECFWVEPLVWACAPDFMPKPGNPLPLIGTASGSADQLAAQTLLDANVRYEMALVTSDWGSRQAAALAGLGYIFIPRRVVSEGLRIASEDYLPPLPDITYGIHVSPHADSRKMKSLVAGLARVFMPREDRLPNRAKSPQAAEAL